MHSMEGLKVNEFIKKHVEALKSFSAGVTDNAVFYKSVREGEDNIELSEEIKFPVKEKPKTKEIKSKWNRSPSPSKSS